MAPFHASHDRMADLTFLLLIHRRAKIQDNGTHVSIEPHQKARQARRKNKLTNFCHFCFASFIFLWGIYFSPTIRGKKKQIIQCTKGTVKNAPKKNGRQTPPGSCKINSLNLQPTLSFQVYSRFLLRVVPRYMYYIHHL